MAALALGAWNSPDASAREAARTQDRIDIAATTLPEAIAELAREARVSIGTEGPLPRLRTPRVRGDMPVGEALDRILAGSGFAASRAGATAWRIHRAAPAPVRPAAPVSAPPAPEPSLAPIVVTATKQPLALQSLPAAVSVVRLGDSGHDTAADTSAAIASRLEGLALTSLGPGRNRMFLRGVADSAFGGESQSTVAVVLDEARLTYAAPDPDIRLVDMERVEVLKGPQGSLYGTGALGGIYRMVTRPADLEDTSLAVSAGGTLVAYGDAGRTLSAVANVPLLEGMSALRVVGYRSGEPGWVDTGNRRNGNASRVSGARAQLGVVPAQDWRIDLIGFGQWLASRDSRYVYAPHAYARSSQLREPHDNDLRHLAARAAGTLGSVDVLVAGAITWHNVDDTQDATVGAEDLGLANPQLLLERRSYRTSDSELRLRGSLGRVDWLAGLAYLDASQRLVTSLAGASGSALTLDDDRRDSHDAAAYLDITVPLTGRLSLDGGARLFRSSIVETRRFPTGPVVLERTRTGLTPSLALAWQPNPGRLVYVRYGSAFRQGGTDISATGSVEALKGDELASIEAGWRERLAGGGHLELSAWYSRWENVQSDVLRSDGLIETTNAGDAAILGIEGNLDMPLAPGWRAEAGASITDAQLRRNALGFRLDDRRMPVVPEYVLRAALRHDFGLGPFDAWIHVNLRLVGPARMSFDRAIDRGMGDRVESELTFNLKRDRWQFGLVAQNLLNDRGNVFAFGNALRYRSTPQFSPQQPTTMLANLRLEL